jgi:hypothetical protein
VLDTFRFVTDAFDIVFTSFGITGWLPYLKPWALVIEDCLKPDGTFYMVSFHIVASMFNYTHSASKLAYHYAQTTAI